jgi:hypothetical protein
MHDALDCFVDSLLVMTGSRVGTAERAPCRCGEVLAAFAHHPASCFDLIGICSRISASNDARDRNNRASANQIKLQTSLIEQKHRPIRLHLPVGLGFRQGQQVSLQQDRARHDLQARRSRRDRLAPLQRTQLVAESHPRCKVRRRNRDCQTRSSSRCRLTPSVTKIRR